MLEIDVIITNGYVAKDTIFSQIEKGWNFVVTVPAKNLNPHALETDKATLFSRYTEECSPTQLSQTSSIESKEE